MPVASTATIAATMTSIIVEPGPSGTAWRRTVSGESTASTSGLEDSRSSARQVPCSRRWSPGCSSTPADPTTSLIPAPPTSTPLRWIATTTTCPSALTEPGDMALPTSSERGFITTSARPDCRLNSTSAIAPSPSGAASSRDDAAKRSSASAAAPEHQHVTGGEGAAFLVSGARPGTAIRSPRFRRRTPRACSRRAANRR